MRQLGELTVADYMTYQAITIRENDKLTKAIRTMDDEGISVLPAVDKENHVVGVLSNSDLIEITHEIQSDLNALRHVGKSTQQFLLKLLMEQGDSAFVADVMTSPVKTVQESTNLIVAAKYLIAGKCHLLPVVDDDHSPVGILSSTDFVRAIADIGGLLAGTSG